MHVSKTHINWAQVIASSKQDLQAAGPNALKGNAVVYSALVAPGTRLLFLHRLQQFIGTRNLLARILSSLIWNVGYALSGCNIGRNCQIAGGVVIPHPVGIVIGEGCKIASGCRIYQNVTLGAALGENDMGYPILFEGSRICPGACVFGALTIAPRTVVGANSVLLESTTADSVYVGAPARRITTRKAVPVPRMPERISVTDTV